MQTKKTHPELLCLRKYEGRYLYWFLAMNDEDREYLLSTKKNCVRKLTTKHNWWTLYFFDLDKKDE